MELPNKAGHNSKKCAYGLYTMTVVYKGSRNAKTFNVSDLEGDNGTLWK